MADPKEAEQAEREAVKERQADEPDEQIGHLSPIEQAREEVLLEQGKLVQQTLIEEQENRDDDDPLEIAKRERTEAGVRMAGEAERHQAAVDKSDREASDEYAEMSLDDLSAEAENRGLAKSGTKKELQQRLRDSDAA